MENLVISPCSNPELSLEEALAAYSRLGFLKFEVFTTWVRSAFDIDSGPARYLEAADYYGMRYTSFHLPPIDDDLDASLARAIQAARFAKMVGAGIVIYKATSRANYVRAAQPLLDATEGLSITPVLQNHAGSPISTLEDYREVIDGIGDPRMRSLLEVGHFHSAGVSWREGYELLGDSIALVHIKDQVGAQSVPFGEGEIDLLGLFQHMRSVGYTGDYVVEMEVEDLENTLQYLEEALTYLRIKCLEESDDGAESRG
jgi:sugar phosphate isomerase/epimerase